ncbi:MAG: peptide chain release factor N(5)-glutamine methyltransferase [Candidatus Gracilibacteria bacterium]
MQIRELLKNSKVPSLDAEVLLAYVLGEDREYLIAWGEKEVARDLVLLFGEYEKRAVEGHPVAYIVGKKEFYGLDFFVDKRVLIPRPETEMLVAEVLAYLKENSERKNHWKILDVGTGSGNIAVSIAKNLIEVDVEIEAVDVSEDALEVARVNAAQHGVDDRIHFFQGDLLEFAEEGEKFDVIVANLPYIGTMKNNFVEGNVKKYEPNSALFGGGDGLELYKKLFQQICDKKIRLEAMFGEFGDEQTEELKELLNKYFEHEWRIEKDLAGIDRLFVVNRV